MIATYLGLASLLLVGAGFSAKRIANFWKFLRKPFLLKPDANLPISEQYAVAIGAHLSVMNGNCVNDWGLLQSRRVTQVCLARDWGIADRKGALEAITLLLQGGAESSTALPMTRDFLESKTTKLPPTVDARAWDLGRVVNICRWACALGLIFRWGDEGIFHAGGEIGAEPLWFLE